MLGLTWRKNLQLTVNELWSEVSRLNINAPPRSKKAILINLVSDARKGYETSTTTRGRKRTGGEAASLESMLCKEQQKAQLPRRQNWTRD